MKQIAIVFALMLSSIVFSQTQAEMNKESYDNFAKADKQLNLVYTQILKKYSRDTIFLKKLKTAQNLWIKFRDAEAQMKYPEDDAKYHYGSVFPMRYNIYLQQLTEQRIKDLKVWLTGYDEGNVCNGSVR